MDALVIKGPAKLKGSVDISGSKNAALPFLFASLLFDGEVVFENVPRLWDIETTLKLLEWMGAKTNWNKEEGVVRIHSQVTRAEAPYELVRQMRAGILALGPLVAKYGHAKVSLPGGCAIGARPVDYHLSALEKMGVEIAVDEGYITAKVRSRLHGAEIHFPRVTVTGTENLLVLAACAEGESILKNAACEPEVVALGELLIRQGAQIEGLGTSEIQVRGVKLRPLDRTIAVPADRIETGTWIAVAAATRSPLTLRKVRAAEQKTVIEHFEKMGVSFEVSPPGDEIRVIPADSYRPIEVVTAPFPGFATDMQAQILACLCLANGESRVREMIFENRFMHVAELKRMGADIQTDGNLAVIRGPAKLRGAPVMATDLRASASLVIAGLCAEGTTKISRIYHLDRGYQRLDEKLRSLGAQIERIKE